MIAASVALPRMSMISPDAYRVRMTRLLLEITYMECLLVEGPFCRSMGLARCNNSVPPTSSRVTLFPGYEKPPRESTQVFDSTGKQIIGDHWIVGPDYSSQRRRKGTQCCFQGDQLFGVFPWDKLAPDSHHSLLQCSTAGHWI